PPLALRRHDADFGAHGSAGLYDALVVLVERSLFDGLGPYVLQLFAREVLDALADRRGECLVHRGIASLRVLEPGYVGNVVQQRPQALAAGEQRGFEAPSFAHVEDEGMAEAPPGGHGVAQGTAYPRRIDTRRLPGWHFLSLYVGHECFPITAVARRQYVPAMFRSKTPNGRAVCAAREDEGLRESVALHVLKALRHLDSRCLAFKSGPFRGRCPGPAHRRRACPSRGVRAAQDRFASPRCAALRPAKSCGPCTGCIATGRRFACPLRWIWPWPP